MKYSNYFLEWHNRDFFLLFLFCFATALSSPFCSHRTFILNVTSAELAFTTETKQIKKKQKINKRQRNVFIIYTRKIIIAENDQPTYGTYNVVPYQVIDGGKNVRIKFPKFKLFRYL